MDLYWMGLDPDMKLYDRDDAGNFCLALVEPTRQEATLWGKPFGLPRCITYKYSDELQHTLDDIIEIFKDWGSHD